MKRTIMWTCIAAAAFILAIALAYDSARDAASSRATAGPTTQPAAPTTTIQRENSSESAGFDITFTMQKPPDEALKGE